MSYPRSVAHKSTHTHKLQLFYRVTTSSEAADLTDKTKDHHDKSRRFNRRDLTTKKIVYCCDLQYYIAATAVVMWMCRLDLTLLSIVIISELWCSMWEANKKKSACELAVCLPCCYVVLHASLLCCCLALRGWLSYGGLVESWEGVRKINAPHHQYYCSTTAYVNCTGCEILLFGGTSSNTKPAGEILDFEMTLK